jgi:hypothetical protein
MSAALTRVREVDRFGNVAQVIHDGGQLLGWVLKTGSGKWRAESPWLSWAPVPSIKAGERWLVQLWEARKLPPDPRTAAEMRPVRAAEYANHAGETFDCPNGHGADAGPAAGSSDL